MAKLERNYFSELDKAQKQSVKEQLEDRLGLDSEYMKNKYSSRIVDVEVVYDENGTLYDARVFDPYNKISGNRRTPIYIGFNGWSNWLGEYRDNAGNDIDDIFDEYDGETQD